MRTQIKIIFLFVALIFAFPALAIPPARNDGGLDFGDSQAAAVSASGRARIRYNNSTHVFEQSLNGGAYSTLGGGGGGTTQTIDVINATAATGKTLTAAVANSGTNVGTIIDNSTTLSGTTLLLSVRNNTVEKFNISNAGVANAASYFTTPAGGSGGLFNTAATIGLEVNVGSFAVATYGGGIGPINSLTYVNGDGTHVWTETWSRHFNGGGGAPTCTAGVALGTGGSVGCAVTAGTDTGVLITPTAGTTSLTTGVFFTITPNTTWTTVPFCAVAGASQAGQAGVTWDLAYDRAASATNSLVFKVGTAPSSGSAYPVSIICVQ